MTTRSATSDLAREMVFKLAVERVDVAVDWPALFAEFCAQHGEPVIVPRGGGSLLLFPDGWSHSADSHRGPSWPPPAEPLELRRLRVEYWQERKRTVQAELDRYEWMTQQLQTLSQVRGVPVPVKRRYVEDGRFKVSDDRFDAATFQVQRIGWLRGDLERCDEKLKELMSNAIDQPESEIRQEPAANSQT